MPGSLPAGVEIVGPAVPGAETILTPEALSLVADLQRRFGPGRQDILAARTTRYRALAAGASPDFLDQTREAGMRKFKLALHGANAQT